MRKVVLVILFLITINLTPCYAKHLVEVETLPNGTVSFDLDSLKQIEPGKLKVDFYMRPDENNKKQMISDRIKNGRYPAGYWDDFYAVQMDVTYDLMKKTEQITDMKLVGRYGKVLDTQSTPELNIPQKIHPFSREELRYAVILYYFNEYTKSL